jgi:hypothetical protein
MATNYIRKFEIGGLHVEASIDATNYVGDKNDVWTDDNDPTVWRIGDGVTPGGQLLISGLGSGITLSNLSVQQTAASGNGLLSYNSTNGVFTYTPPVVPADVSDLTDTTNLLVHNTFDGDYNSLTNTPTIPADVSELTDTTNLLGGGLANLVEDTTPELGGELDADGNGVVNINTLQLTPISSAPASTEGTLAIDDGTNWSGVANQESLVIFLNGAWRAILTTGV